MHGIGNDFVMMRADQCPADTDWSALAQQTCSRRFGIGADGLILADRSPTGGFAMRMWNPDGSESEMCGNGVRCFAHYLRDQGLTEATEIPVETGAGTLVLRLTEDGQVAVAMGRARLTRGEIGMTGPADQECLDEPVTAKGETFRGTAVSMGNPHLVMPVMDVQAIALAQLGPAFEHHEWFPARVNAHWVQVVSRDHIIQRTWERGAGVTLACGTGACAAAVSTFRLGLTDRKVRVSLPGGDLVIEYTEDGQVTMTGPAATVYTGEWELGE